MGFRLEAEYLNGIKVIVPDVYTDERGFFMESFRADGFAKLGLPTEFLQENHSCSAEGVLRGLHFQWDAPMGKLLRVTHGEALLVEVDIRPDSPTLGQWISIELSSKNRRIVWVPAGFANGFLARTDGMEMNYKCTAIYNPTTESGIRWNDPELGIKWGIGNPILSEKDRTTQMLSEWLEKPESSRFRIKQ
ncbi:MAG: dTDP-4-dehydrorhamnose 3,5-epimerase [Bacteroidetes bacterium]|nr:dTDP-4-dehydrorhamnose 3,5-epimerase [Bacteroidota bacterium]